MHPVEDGTTLGRIETCGIVLADPAASRVHARVELTPNGYVIEDQESANGTQVNGQRITRVLLDHGDRVRICGLEFLFVLGSDHPAPDAESDEEVTATITPPLESRKATKVAPPAELEEAEDEEKEEVTLARSPSREDTGWHHVHSEMEVDDQKVAKDLRAARSTNEFRQISRRLELINDVSTRVGTILDLDELLDSVMRRLFQVLPSAERGHFLMVDPVRKKLIVKVTKHRSTVEAKGVRVSRTILQKAFMQKKAILFDATEDTELSGSVSIAEFNIHSMMCVPLVCRNEVLGVITIDTTQRGQKFTEQDLQLLTAIASPIATAVKNAQLVKEKEAEVATRTALERYFSPNLVEKLATDELLTKLGGERHVGIAFFSDIVGFTKMSKRMSPEQVVDLLNRYFSVMLDVLFHHHATVDKFSGDAIMAVWGAPEEIENGPWHAVQAALGMQNALFDFNCSQRALQLEPVYMGVGLNYGEFIAGNVGAGGHQVNYTIIGEHVNLASRIEAKASRGQIFVSESAYEQVKDCVCAVKLSPTTVKGIPDPITIYSIRGVKPIEAPESELLLSLPLNVTASSGESQRAYLVGVRGDPPLPDLVFDLLCPPDFSSGQETRFTFDVPELPELGEAQAKILAVAPRGDSEAASVFARARIEDAADALTQILRVGEPLDASIGWESLVR